MNLPVVHMQASNGPSTVHAHEGVANEQRPAAAPCHGDHSTPRELTVHSVPPGSPVEVLCCFHDLVSPPEGEASQIDACQ